MPQHLWRDGRCEVCKVQKSAQTSSICPGDDDGPRDDDKPRGPRRPRVPTGGLPPTIRWLRPEPIAPLPQPRRVKETTDG